MMRKIICNEWEKYRRSKLFLFEIVLIIGLAVLGCMAYIDMMNNVKAGLPRANAYSEDIKYILMHMNGIRFSRLFLTDFVYKSFFSFFILFVVIHTADIFAADREKGMLKFTLLTGVDRRIVTGGKILFVACISTGLVLFQFVVSLFVGCIRFGTGHITWQNTLCELGICCGLSMAAVLPACAIAVIVAVLSQFHVSSRIVMGGGIFLAFVLGILDTMTMSGLISPIGVLSIFSDELPTLSANVFLRCTVSVGYIAVESVLLFAVVEKNELFE